MHLIFIIILFVATTIFAQPNGGISFVSEAMVTGNYEDVKVVEDLLYCANRYGVVVYDLADWDPEDPPIEAARFPTVGTAYGLFIQDSLCFVADGGNGLGIYDISDFHSVEMLGYCEDATPAVSVTVQDEIVYVLAYRTGVYSVNVSDPQRPQELGLIDARSEIRTMIVYDDVLWIGAWGQEHDTYLTAIDISEPHQMRLISQLLDYSTADFAIESEVAFIGTGTLRSIDISNPLEMQLLDTLVYRDNQGYIHGMSGSLYNDGKLYGDRGPTSIADVSDPNNLQRLGFLQTDGLSRKLLAIWNDYLLATAYERGLKIVDIGDPREPELIHINNNTGIPLDVVVQGNYLYVADALPWIFPTPNGYQGRFRVFSIEDIYNPQQVAVVDSFYVRGTSNEHDQAVALIDTIAYFGWGSLSVISVVNPNNPTVIHRNIEAALSSSSIFHGNYTITVYNRAIIICSFTDHVNPELVAIHVSEDHHHALGCVATDTLLYVPTSYNWEYSEVLMYDWSDPEELHSVGEPLRIPRGHKWEKGIKSGDYLYWIAGSWDLIGLTVVSVADPLEPELVYFTEEVRHGRDIKLFNNLLFIADGNDGVKVFTLDDPEEPELLASYDTPGVARKLDVDVERGYMTVADKYDVSIYDVGQILGVWHLTLSATEHDFGEIAVDSTINWELVITNQTQRDIAIDSVIVSNDVFISELDSVLVLAAGQDTVLSISFSPDTSDHFSGQLTIYSQERQLDVILYGTGVPLAVSGKDDIPLEFALHPAFPNPFNSVTQIDYQLDRDAHVTLKVFDLSGREVAKLVKGRQSAGVHQTVWNCSNLSSGLYIIRLHSGESTISRKVLLMK